MDKIKVEICMGTTCYILGSAALQNLADFLPPELAEQVEVTGCACLGQCRSRDFGRAPFVRINESIIVERADAEKVIAELRKVAGVR